MKYQLCPKCKGQGVVSRPPWIPADQGTWSASQTSWQCDVCNGAKTLLVPELNVILNEFPSIDMTEPQWSSVVERIANRYDKPAKLNV